MTGAAAVEVTSAGQLGIVMSAARYKHDVREMGDKTRGLLTLRPVTFRLQERSERDAAVRAGRGGSGEGISEAGVYGPDGKVMTVRSSMLVNELQKQNSELRNQTATNQRQAEQLGRQAEQIKKMTEAEASTRRALEAQRAAFEAGSANTGKGRKPQSDGGVQ